ncbi:MAG: hypothetical protein ACE5R6_09565 [Candidatus Heimdallarchaeota archaeon]
MSTVRLDEEDEILLERLRARYILLGKKMTKKELLGQLIKQAAKKYEKVQIPEDTSDLETDPAWILLQKPRKWGIRDTSTTVDDYLYQRKGA